MPYENDTYDGLSIGDTLSEKEIEIKNKNIYNKSLAGVPTGGTSVDGSPEIEIQTFGVTANGTTNTEYDGILIGQKMSLLELKKANHNIYENSVSVLANGAIAPDGSPEVTVIWKPTGGSGGGVTPEQLASAVSAGVDEAESYADAQDVITLTAAKEYTDFKTVSIYRPMGSKPTFADLPISGNVAGDVWDILEDGRNYAWTVNETWDNLGGTVDLSEYRTSSEQDLIDEELENSIATKANVSDIKDLNSGNVIKKWYGTQSQYNTFVGDKTNIEFNIVEG